MDEYGIAACVLSVPAVVNHRSKESARDAARRTNELFVETVASHPNRFSAIATVPGRDVDAVLAESQYALDTLKCDGVATSTSIGAAYLGEPQFDPWLEELDHRGATLVFHPSVSAAEQQSALAGLHESVIEFLFEMTRLVTNMVVTGAKRRFANINMIASQRTSSRQPNSGASATRLHLERRSARPVKFPFTPP
jgi:predicted TIM-barrel fold metal-dependent hydrolase